MAQSSKRLNKPNKFDFEKKEVSHRHFRLTAHPPHHERYHHALMAAVLLIILFGVNFISSDNPLGSAFRERGRVPTVSQTTRTLPTNAEYQQSVLQTLGKALSTWEVSPTNVEDTKRAKEQLMELRVPRAYLDAHLGLVLLLSQKEHALEKAMEGDEKLLEETKADSLALVESYQWINNSK